MEEKKNALEKALTILSVFEWIKREVGTNELSQITGIHKSTVSRITNKLADNGYLLKEPNTGKFRLGRQFIRLALSTIEYLNDNIVDLAKPFIDALRDKVGEAVTFTVLYGDDVIVGYVADKPGLFRVNVRVGEIGPFNAAASAKGIFAHLPGEQIDHKIKNGLNRYTKHTITDGKRLRKVFDQIRKQGYSTDNEEMHIGFNAVSIPVFNLRNEAVAAVAVIGLSKRFDYKKNSDMLIHIKEATLKISEQLLSVDSSLIRK